MSDWEKGRRSGFEMAWHYGGTGWKSLRVGGGTTPDGRECGRRGEDRQKEFLDGMADEVEKRRRWGWLPPILTEDDDDHVLLVREKPRVVVVWHRRSRR